jgi:hypothetical protein
MEPQRDPAGFAGISPAWPNNPASMLIETPVT